jgi:hypothetical protein
MRTASAPAARRLLALAVLVGLMTGAAAVGRAPLPAPKRYPVQIINNRPWNLVFEWLTEITGKPVIHTYTPMGVFTFQGPPGRLDTADEIVGIVSDGLFAQPPGYYLLRRKDSFVLILADELPPAGSWPPEDGQGR